MSTNFKQLDVGVLEQNALVKGVLCTSNGGLEFSQQVHGAPTHLQSWVGSHFPKGGPEAFVIILIAINIYILTKSLFTGQSVEFKIVS